MTARTDFSTRCNGTTSINIDNSEVIISNIPPILLTAVSVITVIAIPVPVIVSVKLRKNRIE